MNIFDPLVSGSLSVSGSAQISGSLTVLGNISGITSNALTSSYVEYNNVANKPSLISGSGTTNYLAKFTAGGTVGDSGIFESSGNVGIGTTSPTYKLHIRESSTTGGVNLLNISTTGIQVSGNFADLSFRLGDLNSRAAVIRAITTGSSSGNGHNLAFLTSQGGQSPAERMRITSAGGNVLIGTDTDAGFKLDVNGTGRFTGALRLDSTLTNGTHTYTLPNASGTLALSNSISGTTNYLSKFTAAGTVGDSGIFESGGNVGIGTTFFPHSTYKFVVNQGTDRTFGIAHQDNELSIEAYNTSGNASVPLRFYASKYSFNNGDVLIGTTTDAGFRLDVNGTGRFSGALTGTSATFSGNAIFNSSSTDGSFLQLYGNNSGVQIGADKGGGAILRYNSNGNLDIIPRSGFNTSITSGNVGIGTNAPGAKLEVSSLGAGANLNLLRLVADAAATGGYTASLAFSGTSNLIKLSTGSNDSLSFETDGANERMRITSGGNVGIGTSSPVNILSIKQENTSDAATLELTNTSSGSNVTKTARFLYALTDTVGTQKECAIIEAIPDDSNAINAHLRFATRLSDSFPTERMRITSGGNVGIGTTFFPHSTYKFVVNQGTDRTFGIAHQDNELSIEAYNTSGNASVPLRFYASKYSFNNGNVLIGTTTDAGFKLDVDGTGRFSGNLTALAFFTSSDKRKKDIISQDGDLATYRFKGNDQIRYGYIAQDMEALYPNQVSTDNDGMMSLNYIEILVKKVHDLEKEIQLLKNK